MADKKRILYVTQEMKPYTTISEISSLVRELPHYVQNKGCEVRILMPRFGTINERRHRLHEVVRLSGMNIIVDDEDFPLIIKVASIPGARMQVYFLDNEEFFKRKHIFTDAKGKPFDDNADRMIFYCKGVVETVRKFGWPPDIVHCHGWMTSLIPLYLRKAYANDPLFKNSRIIYSVYDEAIARELGGQFVEKAQINNLSEDDLTKYSNGKGITLNKGGIHHADAVIQGEASIEDLKDLANGKPILGYQDGDDKLAAYLDFYKEIMDKEA